jgi:hypothetical protein
MKADVYAPLVFAPGEAYQFDWSHDVVVLGGATTVKAAHLRLCMSRMPFVRAYRRCNTYWFATLRFCSPLARSLLTPGERTEGT